LVFVLVTAFVLLVVEVLAAPPEETVPAETAPVVPAGPS
jgi:hypothetical protein